MSRLRITEIFYSLQGESTTVGLPTVFVRLTGCPLRCHYCDTTYSFSGGESLEIEAIIAQIASFNTSYVTITGGEPLAQKKSHLLMTSLCDAGYEVSLETSGAIDIEPVDDRVMIVMDIKTPASGENEKNCLSNLGLLNAGDQVKLVITDRDDYLWSKQFVLSHSLPEGVQWLFSPVADRLSPASLADWILHDQLVVRFQMQLHKVLWGNVAGK